MADEQRTQEMDPQFEALRRAIAGDVSYQVTRLGQQLRKELSDEMTQQVTSLGQQLSRDIAKQLETASEHLAGHMQVHAEELKDQVTKAAEGYGGTLDGIQRELKDFREEFRNHASNTKLILADHNSRISSLEQVPKR
jgi:gas vesicle protein